jgi:cobalt-zinc-cadmium efflux system outer membrane protein
VQAGLPPNPTVGFEQDTANTDASTVGPGYGGPGYVGGYVEQTIKTANKLQLARAAAAMDLKNAELALIRARNDVATRVRSGYFAVLVARENVRTAKALARLTDAVYRMQVDQVALGGITPAYEPIQTRALALQAYGAVVQARNRATGAWKQLAAALGLPGLPPSELAGSAVMPAPAFEHAAVLAAVLARHTDVQTAAATLQRARYNLRLAQVTPVPDVDVRAMLQKDYTTATRNVAYSLQVGVPVPLWNRNQGGIYEAQARVVEASEQANRARAELAGRLAEAFERYQNARTLLDYYARHIIPDQVRVYRGVYERYRIEPGEARPGFADVVVAQQNLGASVTTYLATLGHFWQAVVDVADLLQTEDLFAGDAVPATECVVALPDLAALLAPPARLDCAPQLPGADAGWPPAAPAGPARRDRPERAPAPRPADDGLGSRLLEPPPEVRRRR